MLRRYFVFLIPLFFLLGPRFASAETAEEMLAGCRLIANAPVSTDQHVKIPADPEAFKCWGAFVVIQEETRWLASSGRQFNVCNSASTTRTQLVTAFVTYLDKNPQRRNDDFVTVAFDALREAFPCKPTAQPK